MKKLAIVSSYNELCGNATYTEVLRKEFAKYYTVEVLSLNVSLLNKGHRKLKKLAEQHIQDLATRLAEFDYVNIQFEAGLLGTHPSDIYRRFVKLARASKKLIVTLHRLDTKLSLFDRGSLRHLVSFQLSKFFKNVVTCLKNNHFAALYERVISYCAATAGVSMIVHTKREKNIIQQMFSYPRVYDHPISFLSAQQVAQYQASADRAEFVQKYHLRADDIIIGIFGFIAPYKGHDTLIQALNFLPAHYKLMIFGSQHPGAIMRDQNVDPYIKQLLDLIDPRATLLAKNLPYTDTMPSLAARVYFQGDLDDEAYINAIMCCDVNVLPYLETNQSGSGNAALTLEAGAKAIFSLNYATLELAKYAPGCFSTFSIGNYIELAEKIKNLHITPPDKTALKHYLTNYNIETNTLLYKNVFENTAE